MELIAKGDLVMNQDWITALAIVVPGTVSILAALVPAIMSSLGDRQKRLDDRRRAAIEEINQASRGLTDALSTYWHGTLVAGEADPERGVYNLGVTTAKLYAEFYNWRRVIWPFTRKEQLDKLVKLSADFAIRRLGYQDLIANPDVAKDLLQHRRHIVDTIFDLTDGALFEAEYIDRFHRMSSYVLKDF